MSGQSRISAGLPRRALRLSLWLAAAAFGLAPLAAQAQYITNAPRLSVGPRITPMSPNIRGRIHYDRPRINTDRPHRPGRLHLPSHQIVIVDPDDGPPPPRRPRNTTTGPSNPGGGTPSARSFFPSGNIRIVPNEVVIELAGNPSADRVDTLARRHRLQRIESQYLALTNTTFFRWRVPDRRSVREVVRALGRDATVAAVQPNQVFSLQQNEMASLPAAGDFDPSQYLVSKLRLTKAHEVARGDNVLVAVIDSGVDVTHPELAGVIADSYDALQSDEGPHTHGTAIAGLIAAQAQLRGTAPAARILAVRAFGTKGQTADSTTFAILKSLDWSVARGAQVINMSFAGPLDPAIGRALANAAKKNIVLVAAAGNAGPKSPPLFPAADPNVIAVSATDANDQVFAASNRGQHITVAAPGVDILCAAPDGKYQVASGTSFSAAEISGVAALVIERKRDVTPKAVRQILQSTAIDIGAPGRDDLFGAGLADAARAVAAVRPSSLDTATAVPLPKPTPVRVQR